MTGACVLSAMPLEVTHQRQNIQHNEQYSHFTSVNIYNF